MCLKIKKDTYNSENIISREVFLYKFLVEYNKHENNLRQSNTNISQGFINYDEENNTDGIIIYVIRNLLTHDTASTFYLINREQISFSELLQACTTLKVDEKLKIKLLDVIFSSSKIKSNFESNGYNLYKSKNDKNVYYCFQKIVKGIYINILFHKHGKFVSCTLSSYNHNIDNGERTFYDDTNIYLETEKNGNWINIRLFDYDKKHSIKVKAELYIDINLKVKNINCISDSSTFTLLTPKEHITYHVGEEKNSSYDIYLNSVDDVISHIIEHFDSNKINNIITDVIQEYKNFNQILQKIGIQI